MIRAILDTNVIVQGLKNLSMEFDMDDNWPEFTPCD
jgi:hypothetical protein